MPLGPPCRPLGVPSSRTGKGWSGTISALERLRAAGVADYHQKAFDFITSTKPFPNAFVAKEQGLVEVMKSKAFWW